MQLINTTLATVATELVAIEDEAYKAARITAKLTFDVDAAGRIELSDRPLPIFEDDVETPVGAVPRDTGGFEHENLELIVNGAAYAPGGRPAPSVDVTLQLDERVFAARVSGDRVWLGDGEMSRPSEPIPFVRMPMTYAQAFGGMSQVWIDETTEVPVSHPANPLGVGMDAEAVARSWCDAIGAPEGFPRAGESRRLPNLEAADELITRWSDTPRPYSWSARPVSIAGPVHIPVDAAPPGEVLEGDAEPPPAPWIAEAARVMRARCHPALLLDEAPGWIVLRGMTPDGQLAVQLPRPKLAVDYDFEGRTGARALTLRRILMLPEERRFTCTYETRFKFRATVGGERSLRVRLDV